MQTVLGIMLIETFKQSDLVQHQVDGLTADVQKKDGSNEETFRR